MLEDGDTVMTHSLVTRQDPKAADVAVVHIFRFEDDRIAELWARHEPFAVRNRMSLRKTDLDPGTSASAVNQRALPKILTTVLLL